MTGMASASSASNTLEAKIEINLEVSARGTPVKVGCGTETDEAIGVGELGEHANLNEQNQINSKTWDRRTPDPRHTGSYLQIDDDLKQTSLEFSNCKRTAI